MRARMPQDVDLEDKLIYGLTPVRFGYLVIAALAAVMVWNLTPLSPYVRLPGCMVLCAAGAVLGWGRFAGRPAHQACSFYRGQSTERDRSRAVK